MVLPTAAILLLSLFICLRLRIDEKPLQDGIYPVFLIANLMLLALFLWLSRKDISGSFRKIERKTWLIIGIILILALCIRVFVAPHDHRIYYDEDIYLNIAQNIATQGKSCVCDYGTPKECFSCIYNKQPYGSPAFYSIFFMIFGVSEKVAFAVSVATSIIGILIIFLISYLLFKKEDIALYSALAFSLIPIHILWSATQSLDIIFLFFSSLAILMLLLYIKKKSACLAFAFFLALSYASQIRPESLLMAPVAAVFFIALDNDLAKTITSRKFLFALSIFLIMIFPTIQHTLNMRNEDWGAYNGEKFSLGSIKGNIIANSGFFFENTRFPLFFTIASIIGLIAGVFSFKRKVFPFLTWFLLFFFIFIPFYAGSFNYGQDVRFSLNLYPAVAIFSGLGFYFLSRIIKGLIEKNHIEKRVRASEGAVLIVTLCIIAITIVPFLDKISYFGEESWESQFYHDFIVRNAPEIKNCIVVSHVTSLFILNGVPSIQTHMAVDNETMKELKSRYDCILFDEGYWCVNDPFHREGICKQFKDQNSLSIYKQETKRDRTYTLYQVEN
ncbi:MAG: glycosyltransferase family 39 protein [Candidatus Woesearchaeota archaeon]|nr:glycosyltransferase family 39 protein [Candidatus Woesearchaeota archaeon]